MSGAKDTAKNGGTMVRAATGCALAFLLCATVAPARGDQEPAPATPAESSAEAAPPAAPPTISYLGGQLKIDAMDATLADILTKVATLTSAKIDIPPTAYSQRMAVVQLGPGPARQVLASLLSDSNVDYLIQASDADPEKIQSVLVMVREKKGPKANGTEQVARAVRSPYARRGMSPPPEPEEAQAPEAQQPESIVVEPSSPAPTQPDAVAPPPPVEPPPTTSVPVQQPGTINSARIAPQPVPTSLDSQGISQTLQQMYQQRMQINQQEHQAPPTTPNP
jgi:hypothetical protein